jgi:hypothetical protein
LAANNPGAVASNVKLPEKTPVELVRVRVAVPSAASAGIRKFTCNGDTNTNSGEKLVFAASTRLSFTPPSSAVRGMDACAVAAARFVPNREARLPGLTSMSPLAELRTKKTAGATIIVIDGDELAAKEADPWKTAVSTWVPAASPARWSAVVPLGDKLAELRV